MKMLTEYIKAAFIASLVAGIAEKLAPKSMSRYVSFVASLILLVFLFSPLKSLGEELLSFAEDAVTPSTKEDADATNPYDALLELSRESAEKAIRKHLLDEFSLTAAEVVLSMKIEDDGTVLLTEIEIVLCEDDLSKQEEIEAYMESVFHTETIVREE